MMMFLSSPRRVALAALSSPNLRRSGPSSLALKFWTALASSLSRSVPTLYPCPIIPLSRFFTPSILLSIRSSSSGSSTTDKIDALENEIVAIKYLLKGGNLTTAPSDIRESVQIYDGSSKDWLRSILENLQKEKSALMKASVESQGRTTPREDKFSAVWTAIVNGSVSKNSSNPRLLSLPGEAEWIGGIKGLYNRPCYDDITKQISSLSFALVIGTPGIGKTLFLQTFLIYLASCAKAEGRATPTIHYTRYVRTKVVTLSFLSDGSVIDITDVRVPEPEYLLSDGVDLNEPSGTVLNLLVASDKPMNYNEFEKRIGETGLRRGATIIMPLWSFDELLCIRPDSMNYEIAQFRYHIYGGSARNFKCLSPVPVTGQVLPVVEDTMNLVFRHAKIDKLYPDEWSNIARHISARLIGDSDANSTDPLTFSIILQHFLPVRQRIWASKFMELLVGAIFKESSDDISAVLRDLIRSSGKGYLFESLGHRKLLMSPVSFTLKPLLNSVPDEKPDFPFVQFNLSVVLFNTISEISRLPDGSYGLPTTSNFPLVDAIVQPNVLIQFTISTIYHTGSVMNLRDICAGLHEKDLTKIKFIFVIPKYNVATFRGQKDLVIEEIAIPQYICLDDPSVVNEIALMTEKEKQTWMQGD